jgi:glycine oxidase
LLPEPDVLILGAGIIGLSLALELRLRGLEILVVDRAAAVSQASWAAAGMLAVEDPHNPPALLPLSRLSAGLYPAFLGRILILSAKAVPFQTDTTVQVLPDGELQSLHEHSIDPRQLAPALLQAVLAAGVRLQQQASGPLPNAPVTVHTKGAWAGGAVAPRKGQMLRVALPPRCDLTSVHRSEHVYVVPRTQGPQARTALIGATVEDAGFDLTTSPQALAHLRRLGADLVPGIADETAAPMVEAWAGLRPASSDGLPLLGEIPSPHGRAFLATGHFRNGILLAPASALLMANLVLDQPVPVDLVPFRPSRFPDASAGFGRP